jgi:2-polyprenyl-6-methoxyphenol hydroxylase-like FAD-dependent oxidoreductase
MSLPLVHINICFHYATAEQARYVRSVHPVMSAAFGEDCFVMISAQDIVDPEDASTWRFQLSMGWKGSWVANQTNANTLQTMKQRGARLAEPFRSAVLWIPDTVQVKNNNITAWVTQPWDTHDGGVALAGDACHAMPPHRGQALNHAIVDVQRLVEGFKAVADGTRKQADVVSEYVEEVVPRGAKEVLLSQASAMKSLCWNDFKETALFKIGVTRGDDAQVHSCDGKS